MHIRYINKLRMPSFLILMLFICMTEAAAQPGLQPVMLPDRIKTQAVVNRIAEAYGAVGAEVAVIRNGLVDDTYAYGSATKGAQAMTADTKIRVASISKVILTMVAMRLREAGVVDLDADISSYWGEPIKNPNYMDIPITIRSILSHTSSIRAYEHGIAKSGAAIRHNLSSGAAFNRAVPGSINSWCYNNYAFEALGLTLEWAANETVNSIADRELFKPLDINASFGYRNSGVNPLATLYHHDGTVAWSVDAQKNTTGNTRPGQNGICFAGGLLISAADLAKLVAVLANDGVYEDQQILSPASVAIMETVNPQKVPDQPFYQGLPLRYQTKLYDQDLLYYHTGSSYGVYSLISYNPVTKNGVVVLTTGASGARDNYGIYSVCGEISAYVYAELNKK